MTSSTSRCRKSSNFLILSVILTVLGVTFAQPPTTTDRDAWVGTYTPKGSCTPSLACCCANGPMEITLDSSPLNLQLNGKSDGGAACGFQSTLGGTFTLYAPRKSYYFVSFISLTANATLSDDSSLLTIVTTHTSCPVIFDRVVAHPVISSSTGSGGGGGSNTGPVDYDSTLQLTAWANANDPTLHDYLVAFAVPITTPITVPTLIYSSNQNPTVKTVDMVAVSSSSSFAFRRINLPASSLSIYVSPPVELNQDDTLIYSFRYKRNGNDFGTTQSTFVFQDDSTIPSNPNSMNNMFIGTYSTIGGCIPSSSCCCAVGNISISSYNSNDIVVTGKVDGGSGCYQQTTLGGIFHMDSTNALFAYNTFSIQNSIANFQAQLASSNPTSPVVLSPNYVASASTSIVQTLKNDYSRLSITNSLYSCPSTAVRVVENGGGGGVSNTELLTTVLGDWYPDGTCVPSETCCCASGKTHISSVPSDASSVMVATVLLGEGLSCMNTDGPIELTFTAVNSTHAVCSPMPLLTFTASLQDNQKILYVSNSIHPTCPSQFVRSQSSDASSIRSMSVVSILLIPWFISSFLTLIISSL